MGTTAKDEKTMTLAPVWAMTWVDSEDEDDFYEAFQGFIRRWSTPSDQIPDHLSLDSSPSPEELAAYETLCELVRKRICGRQK